MSTTELAQVVRRLEPPTYQWVLCDDRQIHAVWDDTVSSCAFTGEPWTGVCKHQITLHLGRPQGEVTVCWPCLSGIGPEAVQAPWQGKTL